MKFEFGVSICKTIDVEEIRTLNRSQHIRVIDLRSNGIGGRYPIQERVVRRLRNYWIDFSQLPTDMRQSTSRQHNELFDMIATEEQGETEEEILKFLKEKGHPALTMEAAV